MAPRAKDRTWTPETDALLAKLWNDGYSCSQIGNRLGLTRNSVMGRIHRLGISRSSPHAIKGERRVADKRKFVSKPKPPEPLPMPEPAPVSAVPTVDLGPGMCRFPVSDGSPWMHCGAKTPAFNDPWCRHHRNICYQPAPKRRVA